jgi:hypothetical protein
VVVMPNGVPVPPLSHSSRVADSAEEERDRQRDKMTQNLMHNYQHILGILYLRVSYMFNLSNSI